MALEIINEEQFKAKIFDFTKESEFQFTQNQPIILNFFASWCGPCHVLAPALEEIAQQFDGKLQVYKVDIDKDPLISALFEVRSVPTTIFLIPNEEPALVSGNIGKSGLDRAVNELFGLS